MPDRHPAGPDGSRGRRRGAGVPETRGKDRAKERWLFGSGPVCVRLAAADCSPDRRSVGVPIRGGPRGMVRPMRTRERRPERYGRPTRRDPAAGAAAGRTHLLARGAGAPAPRLRGRRPRGLGHRGGPRRRAAAGVRDRRAAGPAGDAPRPGARPARRDERRGQLLSQRRLRGLFPQRRPRPRLRACLRPGGRRVRAGAGDRPGPGDQPRGPRVPRRPRALGRRRERGRDPAARGADRAGRLRQPRAGPAPVAAPVRGHDPGLRPVAPGVDPARGRPRASDARRGHVAQPGGVRARHRYRREPAPDRRSPSSTCCRPVRG